MSVKSDTTTSNSDTVASLEQINTNVSNTESISAKTADVVSELTKKMGIKPSKRLSRIIAKTTKDTLNNKVCSNLNLAGFKDVINENTVQDIMKHVMQLQEENPDVFQQLNGSKNHRRVSKTDHKSEEDKTTNHNPINEKQDHCSPVSDEHKSQEQHVLDPTTVTTSKKSKKKKGRRMPKIDDVDLQLDEHMMTKAIDLATQFSVENVSAITGSDPTKDVDSKTNFIHELQDKLKGEMSSIMAVAAESMKKINKKKKKKKKTHAPKCSNENDNENDNGNDNENDKKEDMDTCKPNGPVAEDASSEKLTVNESSAFQTPSREELSARLNNRLQRLSNQRSNIVRPTGKSNIAMDLSQEKLDMLKNRMNTLDYVQKEEALMYICKEYGDAVGDRIRQAVIAESTP